MSITNDFYRDRSEKYTDYPAENLSSIAFSNSLSNHLLGILTYTIGILKIF